MNTITTLLTSDVCPYSIAHTDNMVLRVVCMCFMPEKLQSHIFLLPWKIAFAAYFYDQYLNIVSQAAVILNTLTFNETSKYVNTAALFHYFGIT